MRFSVSILLLCGALWTAPSAAVTVRVGLWENKPMCSTGEDGKPEGIFVSVIEYVADHEGWDLEYVRDDFPNLRSRLEDGELEIVLSLAVTEERERLYTFNRIDVVNNWGVVYTGPESDIESLLDLQAELQMVPEYGAAMEAVRRGQADARVSRFVMKPYAIRELEKAICSVLDDRG